MSFSVIFKIFYIPFTNIIELVDILKSHGNLLTILFCSNIITASANSLNPSTTGIMSAVLGIIVIYKLITSLKKTVQ